MPGIREACEERANRRHVRLPARGRRTRFGDVNFGLVARAEATRDHQVMAIGGHVDLEHDVWRVRPVVDKSISFLRLADTMEPDLTEVLLLLVGYRPWLWKARVEKA